MITYIGKKTHLIPISRQKNLLVILPERMFYFSPELAYSSESLHAFTRTTNEGYNYLVLKNKEHQNSTPIKKRNRRIEIPKNLCSLAGITQGKKIFILGVNDRIEIWNSKTLQEYDSKFDY